MGIGKVLAAVKPVSASNWKVYLRWFGLECSKIIVSGKGSTISRLGLVLNGKVPS